MSEKSIEATARIMEFDVLKTLAIFLVLWGHSLQHLMTGGKQTPIFIIISTFHMPLFMMIAGFFSSRSLRLPIGVFFKKKARDLLYPCLTFGLFFFILFIIMSLIEGTVITVGDFFNYAFACFWFLKSLFFCYILAYICNRLVCSRLLGGVIAIALSQLIPLFKMNWMMPFFVLGNLLAENIGVFQRHRGKLFVISTSIFLLLIGLWIDEVGGWNSRIQGIKQEFFNLNFSAISTYLIIQFQRIFIGLAGTVTFLSGVFLLTQNASLKGILEKVGLYGKETLGIYIIQTILLETLLHKFMDLSSLDLFLSTFIITPLVSLVMLWVCYKISASIHANRLLSNIFFLR